MSSFVLRAMRPRPNAAAATGMGMRMGSLIIKPVSSPFSPFSSHAAQALKETNRDHPDAGIKYEEHKQEQLRKQKEGKAEWKAELASDSEEAVVADSHEHSDHSEKGLRDLQEKTAGVAEGKGK